MGIKIDLTNQKFNKLTVLREVPKEERKNKKQVEWECQCDCGQITRVITNYLKSGHTKSCGCQRKESMSKLFSLDIIGHKYNKLLVIEKTEQRASDGSVIWKCKCDCGNIHFASTNSLRTGTIQSCGCQRSRGEAKINQILFENNVNYQTQFWFKDLKDKKYLYFDFAILDDEQNVKCLVEYQGIQHYDPTVLHGAWSNAPQEHDELKRQYCKLHNINLIELPYTDFETLNWEYLKNRLGL